MLGRGEPSIHQVIEPDDEPAGMWTQGGAKDGSGEPTDKRAKDKRSDARAGRHLASCGLRITGRTEIEGLVNLSQHLLTLPKPRRGSPSTH